MVSKLNFMARPRMLLWSMFESEQMQAQVKHLQARCDRLLEVTKQVDEGLDKTIDRLKFVLED